MSILILTFVAPECLFLIKKIAEMSVNLQDAAMTTTFLLNLPPELKLNFSSDLPVKDILGLRSVCADLRDVIDNSENPTMLLQPGIQRELSRLQDAVKATLRYDPKTDFMTALQPMLLIVASPSRT